MIFLAGTIASSLCMTFLMKYSESHNGNRYALNIWNYLAGTIFSFFLLTDKSQILYLEDGGITLIASIFNGIYYVVSLVATQMCIVKNGAPLTSTFSRLGVLIPTILSAIFFHEIPGVLQLCGLVLAIFAIIYINTGSQEEMPAFRLILLLVFIFGGSGDFVNKVYSMNYDERAQKYFVMYTFFFALIVSIIIFFYTKSKMTKQDAILGIGVGIPNQLTALLVMLASMQLPAYIVYPTYSAGLIILVNVINYLVFKEKLTRRQYIATVIIAIAIVCINL